MKEFNNQLHKDLFDGFIFKFIGNSYIYSAENFMLKIKELFPLENMPEQYEQKRLEALDCLKEIICEDVASYEEKWLTSFKTIKEFLESLKSEGV